MKKNILIGIIALVLLVLVGIGYWVFKGTNANDEDPDLLETPPTVSTVNALALSKRPYVELIPHSNASRCNGVDMRIDNLKNGETKVEYELEYTTTKLIQGVFGRREFTEEKEEHAPLEFGTCSRGKCKCDDDITGGSLKLSFEGSEAYVLKGDFTVQKIGEKKGVITSRDVRLTVDFGDQLDDTTDVLIASTLGLPKDLESKVILGPYGIFIEKVRELKQPAKVSLQSKDVTTGKIYQWTGEDWQLVEAEINEDKATFEIEKLGVIVLTE